MLDAGSLNPGGELRAKLLRQLRGNLTAEESGDLFGFTLSTDCRVSCS
jgi:hypothetical protein